MKNAHCNLYILLPKEEITVSKLPSNDVEVLLHDVNKGRTSQLVANTATKIAVEY